MIAGLFGILPAVVGTVLIGHFFTSTFRGAAAFGPDEVIYWRQIQAFATAGFETGYFTIHERPAPARFSRFGTHGPAFPVLYGAIARTTGWRPYSAPLVGVILIGIGLALWSFATRAAPALSLAAVATFWPLALVIPTTMQEPLHYAIATLAALMTWRVATRRAASVEAIGWTLLLCACGLLRPTWILLAVPLSVVMTDGMAWKYRAIAIVAAFGLAGAVYAVFTWLASPYPESPAAIARNSAFVPVVLVQTFAARAVRGAIALVASPAPVIELWVRAMTVVMFLAASLQWLRAPDANTRRTAAAIAIWLGLTLGALTAFGSVDPGRDVRVLGPALFVSLLVWISIRARRIVVFALIAQVAIAPWALKRFAEVHANRFLGHHTRHLTLRREIADVLQFKPGAPPWTNTVLVSAEIAQDQAMLGLPAGFGTSAVLDWRAVGNPPRSRFVLIGPRDTVDTSWAGNLIERQRTLLGVLYENPPDATQ